MKVARVLSILGLAIGVAALSACSGFASLSSASSSAASLSTASPTGTTVLLATQHNLLGINQRLVQTPASAQTIAVYAKPHSVLERGNLLPNLPQAAGLNSSQQMVYMLVAAEHCRDLVTAEAAIPDAAKSTRKFFKQQNLATGSATLSAGDFTAAGSALGTGFWRRASTSDELSLYGDMYSEFSGESLTNQNMLISLCSVELASASSLVH